VGRVLARHNCWWPPAQQVVSRQYITGVQLFDVFSQGPRVGAVEKLEPLIKSLSPEEFAQFREWFAEFDAQVWDRQIEADAAAGKLDRLVEESMADHRANKNRPF